MYRPCRRKKRNTVPSRRGRNYIPSRPVVKNYMHRPVPSKKYIYIPSRPVETIFIYRPVPSRQFLLTVPSRHDNFYLPSRPVMKEKCHCTVRSRPVEKIHTHRPVPSHPGSYNFHLFYRPVPSRLQNISRQTCQNSTVPSRLQYYQP